MVCLNHLVLLTNPKKWMEQGGLQGRIHRRDNLWPLFLLPWPHKVSISWKRNGNSRQSHSQIVTIWKIFRFDKTTWLQPNVSNTTNLPCFFLSHTQHFPFQFQETESFIHTTLKGETMTCFFRVYLVQGKCQRPREMSNVLLTVCPSCLYAKINFLFPKLKRKCFFHFRNFSKTESSSHQSPCLTMVTTVKKFFDCLFTCCSSLENFSKHTSSWSCPTFLRHPSKVISIFISIFLSPSEPFSVLQGWWLPCLASDPLTPFV